MNDSISKTGENQTGQPGASKIAADRADGQSSTGSQTPLKGPPPDPARTLDAIELPAQSQLAQGQMTTVPSLGEKTPQPMTGPVAAQVAEPGEHPTLPHLANASPAPPSLPGTSVTPRSLEQLEQIIAAGLNRYDDVSAALFEIHARKLYKPGYGSFRSYLRRRWGMSRSRGYQLLHYARLKQMSTRVDNGPQNERQARRLDNNGQERQTEAPDLICRVMLYLGKYFEQLPGRWRWEYITAVQELLLEMAERLTGECGTFDAQMSSIASPRTRLLGFLLLKAARWPHRDRAELATLLEQKAVELREPLKK